jgi:transmembrane sensor
MDGELLTAEEQTQLDGWLASDPRHAGALARAQALWFEADRLGALASATTPGSKRPAFGWQSAHALIRHRGLLAAFALSLALASGIYWYGPGLLGAHSYTSEIGEVRNIDLADGSELTLNTDTRATVHLAADERSVALTRGEAHFKVAHDVARPFVVRANGVRVTAIGTSFSVRVDDARVDVLVTEGVVEVSRVGAAEDSQRVTANHRAIIASSESRLDVETIDRENLRRQLAWREGMAIFAGEPLGVAVAEINRHSRQRIYVDDAALAERPVIGIFHASDAEGFASAAAATLGATVSHESSGIHLRMPGS